MPKLEFGKDTWGWIRKMLVLELTRSIGWGVIYICAIFANMKKTMQCEDSMYLAWKSSVFDFDFGIQRSSCFWAIDVYRGAGWRDLSNCSQASNTTWHDRICWLCIQTPLLSLSQGCIYSLRFSSLHSWAPWERTRRQTCRKCAGWRRRSSPPRTRWRSSWVGTPVIMPLNYW